MITFASGGPIAGSFTAGLKAGRSVSFNIQTHNREFPPSMGGIQLNVDGGPVLVDIGSYGLDSSLCNAMCFDDGGCYTQGQYLNGNVGPEKSSYIRRCLIGERFIYAHAVITSELHPRHEVKRAERIIVVDQHTGAILVSDSFEGNRPLHFATHLHCSGSVTDLGAGSYRLTGGQANLIAGIKDGDKGLSDDEKGEIFVSVLEGKNELDVKVEEPVWHPTYIYGLNGNPGEQDIRYGRFPHYKRWRLAYPSQVKRGSFLFAITSAPGEISVEEDQEGQEGAISLTGGASLQFGGDWIIKLQGIEIRAETVISDPAHRRLTAIGLRELRTGEREVVFTSPVDIELELHANGLQGKIFASTYSCRSHFVGAIGGGQPSAVLSPVGEVLASSTNYFDFVTTTVNLDCAVVHLDYNMERLRRLKSKYGLKVKIADPGYLGSVLISCETEECTIEDFIQEFNIERLDDYLDRASACRRAK